MKKKDANDAELIEAVRDLTRVLLSLSGKFASKAEMIRELDSLSIPASRIALILGMKLNDVTSALSKAKKMNKTG